MPFSRTQLTAPSAVAAAFALLLLPALFPSAGSTQGSRPRETVTVAADKTIPNLPGKRLVTHIVDYAPGGRSAPHRHAGSAFIYAYVVSGEIFRAPRSWVEKAYHNLVYFNEVDRGGHFAAWEEPDLFATEIRAGFRSLR